MQQSGSMTRLIPDAVCLSNRRRKWPEAVFIAGCAPGMDAPASLARRREGLENDPQNKQQAVVEKTPAFSLQPVRHDGFTAAIEPFVVTPLAASVRTLVAASNSSACSGDTTGSRDTGPRQPRAARS